MAVDVASKDAVADAGPPDGPGSTTSRRARAAGAAGRSLLAVPSVAWTVLFFIAPLVLLVVYSFGTTNLLTFQVDFG